jgi:precorrin-2 dehydrogenase/sirohydrochlorin ferrochelatase
LNDEVIYRIEQKQVDYVDRKFEPSDLDGADMVLTAVDDPEASTRIWKLCKERKIAANIADVPPECDFYFGRCIEMDRSRSWSAQMAMGPNLPAL